MIEQLIQFDQKLFTLLNGWGIPFFDPVMRLASATWIWIPVYLFLILFMLKSGRRKGIWAVIFLIITYFLTEQLSVHAFKEVFERLRPCHDPDMAERVRLVVNSCGGRFSFVSTHATNASGLVVFSILFFMKKSFTWPLLIWALIVSYSRIYVGVHYPGDILGGWILGTIIGLLTFALFKLIYQRQLLNGPTSKEN
ncbi:MAG: phosphatase PAP2 family protein [Bacteroidetes bacterium]|jgi:undecaprenyl-diphosphatase|nr:phosphatase PAP2 family protein [Bacteroidota bacterium]MBT3748551.1 phosphatase PAP2 family protein [Bacteroidota bacterium]MBT4398976.1 phosphatase PAP2 family protein [Bacteroidota bacterium]MBT5426347.1 phosphatase PAP2 family protein [Bacteroidota bacterium]MBT7094909.1 phosphatase PAP2 family protein [Bacteroidota bacterium]